MSVKKPLCNYSGELKELQSGDTLYGASGSPGGSNTNIQYNNSGSFGGSTDFTWNSTSKLLYNNGSIKSNTGEYLTGASGTFGTYNLAKIIFGINTSGNALIVNDIAGAKYAFGTGYYNLSFFKHRADNDLWYKSFVINGGGANYYPQGFSFFTGDNSEKIRFFENGNISLGEFSGLPGCCSNSSHKIFHMPSSLKGGSSILALVSSGINTFYIGESYNGGVFALEGTSKNIDFRTNVSYAGTDPLTEGTVRMRIQGDGKIGIGTGTDSLSGQINVTGSIYPLAVLNCSNSYNNNVILFQREGSPKLAFGLYGTTNIFDKDDTYFAVRDSGGTWREIAAFSSAGQAFKLKCDLWFLGSSSGCIGFKPAANAGSTVYTLPSSDGSSGTFLKTDGSGNLTWDNPSATDEVGGSAVFGNGSDGDITISSDTYLSVDRYYNSLTINSGVKLNTNGFRVFVKNTLTLNGTIHNNGGNASGSTKGSKAGQGTVGKKNGIFDGVNGSITTGSAGTGSTNSCGGSGGAGGNSTYNGGNGGGVSNVAENDGGIGILKALPFALTAQFIDEDLNPQRVNGGSSGGAGGGDGTNAGGGSGGSGGGVIVCAKTITGSGSITANGGNGGSGSGNSAGGGGGGGGFVVVLTNSNTSSLTVTANGGSGGSGAGTGSNGSNGSNGNVYILNNK